SRISALRLRGINFNLRFWRLTLRPFGPVLRTALFAIGHAGGIQRAADHVITHARKILHTAPADEHDRVLLQVVSDSRDVGGHFDPVGQGHARHFPQRRIRLLGSRSVDTRTNSTLLRAAFQRRARSLPAWRFPPITHKLIKRWHDFLFAKEIKNMCGATHHYDQDPHANPRKSTNYRSQLRGLPCFYGQAHVQTRSKSWLTSGPHPRPDPPTDGW